MIILCVTFSRLLLCSLAGYLLGGRWQLALSTVQRCIVLTARDGSVLCCISVEVLGLGAALVSQSTSALCKTLKACAFPLGGVLAFVSLLCS